MRLDLVVAERQSCAVEGCDREAHHGGLCHGHQKRRARGQPLDAPLRPRAGVQTFDPWEAVAEAALAYADACAEDDAQFVWAKARLRLAVLRALRRPEDQRGEP